jgi:hypothetical protein
MKGVAMKEQLRKWAKEHGYGEWQVDEYIAEAEHQEGDEYWTNFQNLGELITDFALYWESYN